MGKIERVESWRPDHVPPELAWDADYYEFAAETEEDPFRRVGELHDGPDMLWVRSVDRIQAGWLPTRHALIREVLTDTDHFASGMSNMMGAIGLDWRLIPLEYDPPQQQLYRKALEPFFTPAAVNALDGAVRKACDELIDGFVARDSCEFASEFAEKFPSHIFLDIMGMPRERLADFLAWERGMLRPQSPEQQVEAMTAIFRYLEAFVREQRRNPTSDLMRGVVNARYNNERLLTETEILSICFILYIGGLDTVYSTLGWIFWYLAQDRNLQDRLRAQPEIVTNAIEELLRAFSVASSQRRLIRDYEFHGVQMRAGDIVQISLPLAARDPQAYDDPHRVDIERPARHVAFGTGPHTCLGLRLAKREIRIVFEAFFSKFRNIHVPKGERHEFHTGNVFGIDRLPLEWERIGA
jgi:cytochrome P450